MQEALGFLPVDDRYIVRPYIAQLHQNHPDFLEWVATLDLGKQIQVLKMIVKHKDIFLRDTMWGFAQYAAFRSSPAQTARRISQDQAQDKESLLALNRSLAKEYGFNIVDLKIVKERKNGVL